MGDPKELNAQQIANINAGCASVGDNEALEPHIAYRIGRLGNYTDSIIRQLQRSQQKLVTEHRAKVAKMTDAQKIEENDKLTEAINKLMDETETISIPELKYSDFIAKEDIRVKDREYKKGQVLVPTKFFSSMGDIIIDDKNQFPKQEEKEKKGPVKKKPS